MLSCWNGISHERSASFCSQRLILPSGQLQTGDTVLPLQTVALLTSIDQISAISIPTADGSTVRLDEIGTVELQSGTPVGYSRTDGQPSVSVRVTKDTNANTVTVANSVVSALDDLNGQLPDGASISIFENQADFITASIRSLVEEGVIGGILAIVVVFLFLRNWRTTLIPPSDPLSLVIAVIVLDQMGYSLNIMTLAGLTIAIGRVIDDSIVVLENVYRHMAKVNRRLRQSSAAHAVTIAILGATATTCARCSCRSGWSAAIGELFLPFAIAVVAALVPLSRRRDGRADRASRWPTR